MFLNFLSKEVVKLIVVLPKCCETKNDVSFDNAEQDLLKAFGGAYVNASLAIITKLGRVQVLVKYFRSPPFCRIHKRCCLAPATVKPMGG